jgi:hypothetical protein
VGVDDDQVVELFLGQVERGDEERSEDLDVALVAENELENKVK